nr:hypothetical protein CFP56_11436 [Quercus suber]
MLSSGQASTCLRCQLRQVIKCLQYQRASRSATKSYSFSTNTPNLAIAKPDLSPRDSPAYSFRHVQVNGQIIGKPGRRQRQQHKSLPVQSLGQPANVVLMQDIIEEPTASNGQISIPIDTSDDSGGALLSSQELEAAIKGEYLTPDQETVNASIEAMRPANTLLEKMEHSELVEELIKSFNARQLAAYLVNTMGTQAKRAPKGIEGKLDTPWTPGTTPLEKRLGMIIIRKESTAIGKRRIAEQVLRLAWKVTVLSESQQIGELEMNFGNARWMMDMLFKTESEDGTLNYQKYLGSQLLARATKIAPYWPNNVVRITGRRQDAEEAAKQLRRRLSKVEALEVDLSRYGSAFNHVPWESTANAPMRVTDLKVIAKLTSTVIIQSAMTLNIYSQNEVSRFNAKRLAISLLDPPSPKNSGVLDEQSSGLAEPVQQLLTAVREDANLMEYPATGVHQRLRETTLYRLTKSLPSITQKHRPNSLILDQSRWKMLSQRLKNEYDQGSGDVSLVDNSYWNIGSRHLAVSYCNLLQPSIDRRGRGRDSSHRMIQHHQPQGLAQLLSCFDNNTKRTSNLTVRLMPQIAGREKQSALPRVFFTMAFNPGVVKPVPVPQYPVAPVNVHETLMRLPAFVADAVFTSSQAITSKAFFEHSHFKGFIRHIQDSVTSGSGVLSGQPGIYIPMPSVYVWPDRRPGRAVDKNTGSDVVDVSYVLEHFEQVQRMRFVPKAIDQQDSSLSPEARLLLAAWPKSAVLEVLMVDAGSFGGRRTEVRLVQPNRLPFKETLDDFQRRTAENTDQEGDMLSFIEGAFLVPQLLTLASRGTLYADGIGDMDVGSTLEQMEQTEQSPEA